MAKRYKVAIGYPQDGNPSGMSTLRLRGHLTEEHFRTWCDLMQTLASRDELEIRREHATLRLNLPPVSSHVPGLLDVMIMQCVSDNEPPWIRMTAALSCSSLMDMIEFMAHWNAVEDELEKEGAR